MDQRLIILLRIIKLNNIKSIFAELARKYDVDWRTVKKYEYSAQGVPPIGLIYWNIH